MSINDKIKVLENIKQRFKIEISWNKYLSEITTQSKNHILDYLIDPTFSNINGLFVLSLKNGNDDPSRNSFDKYHIPILLEIKDLNALIDNKSFFDEPIKHKQEAYEKLIEVSRNDDYTRGNLLYFSYHQNNYRLIGINLSRQTNSNNPQQINFTRKVEKDYGATIFFCWKAAKTILNFPLDPVIVTK